jgi:hypothetical protein
VVLQKSCHGKFHTVGSIVYTLTMLHDFELNFVKPHID